MNKKNELLNCYDEAMKDAKEKSVLVETIIHLKEKMEEKIGYDKNQYLRYKILCERKLAWNELAVMMSLAGIGFTVLVTLFSFIVDIKTDDRLVYFMVAVFYGTLVAIVIVICVHHKCVPKYQAISIVIEEIYKERFEGEGHSFSAKHKDKKDKKEKTHT